MNKKLGLIPSILSGDKLIESRWYVSRFPPWNKIHKNNVIYFKDSGKPVTAKAIVSKVIQFDSLDEFKILNIVKTYGKGINFREKDSKKLIQSLKNKRYCILIYLKEPTKIKPFEVDKTGYGSACAWMVVDDIRKVKA